MIVLLIILSALSMDFRPNMSPEQAMRVFASIEDIVSIDLTDQNFDEKLNQSSWFVNFYDPDCQACKMLKPQWRFLSKKVNNDPELSVQMGKMNVMQNHKTAFRFRLDRFPTLLYFDQGFYYNITAARDQYKLLELLKLGEWKNYQKKPVPPPLEQPGFIQKIPVYYLAVGMMILFLVIGIFSCFFNKSKEPDKKD